MKDTLLNNKKKIAAFTLSEMVVVIILTSLIVGIAFSILSMVQNHMKLIQENFKKKVEYQKLEQSLWLDFNRYSKVSYEAFEEELLFTNELDSTSYKFSSKMIVKALDTFQIPAETIKVFFGGKAVEHGEIDAIKLEANSTYQNKSLFVFKQNDAVKFMD